MDISKNQSNFLKLSNKFVNYNSSQRESNINIIPNIQQQQQNFGYTADTLNKISSYSNNYALFDPIFQIIQKLEKDLLSQLNSSNTELCRIIMQKFALAKYNIHNLLKHNSNVNANNVFINKNEHIPRYYPSQYIDSYTNQNANKLISSNNLNDLNVPYYNYQMLQSSAKKIKRNSEQQNNIITNVSNIMPKLHINTNNNRFVKESNQIIDSDTSLDLRDRNNADISRMNNTQQKQKTRNCEDQTSLDDYESTIKIEKKSQYWLSTENTIQQDNKNDDDEFCDYDQYLPESPTLLLKS